HAYGKAEKPGRKVGHLTVVGEQFRPVRGVPRAHPAQKKRP
ncbi:MAG: hypothetical protein ACF8LK_08530, partial [Phycisphaerales bacterium JB041]